MTLVNTLRTLLAIPCTEGIVTYCEVTIKLSEGVWYHQDPDCTWHKYCASDQRLLNEWFNLPDHKLQERTGGFWIKVIRDLKALGVTC